jgi:hypothetical protein
MNTSPAGSGSSFRPSGATVFAFQNGGALYGPDMRPLSTSSVISLSIELESVSGLRRMHFKMLALFRDRNSSKLIGLA